MAFLGLVTILRSVLGTLTLLDDPTFQFCRAASRRAAAEHPLSTRPGGGQPGERGGDLDREECQ